MAALSLVDSLKPNRFPSLAQLAQEGRRPVPTNQSPNSAGLFLPSQVTSGTARTQYTTWTSGVASQNWDVPPGELWLNVKIRISADRACSYNGTITQMAGQQANELGVYDQLGGVFGSSGGVQDIEIPILHERAHLTLSFQSPATTATPLEQPIVAVQVVSGLAVSMDTNYDAKRVVLAVGDSIISAGAKLGYYENSAVLVSGRLAYPHRVCDALRAEGKSVRLVQRGFGSEIAAEADTAFDSGWYDGIAYDLMIVNRGTNDVPATTTTTDETNFKTSLAKAITHRNRYRPTASIVFVAPTVTDNATGRTLANLPTVRQWINDVATATAGNTSWGGGPANKCYFYDAGTAFSLNATAAADTNFACGALWNGSTGAPGERATGNRLHPGQFGHAAIYSGLYPVIQTTDFYQHF